VEAAGASQLVESDGAGVGAAGAVDTGAADGDAVSWTKCKS